MCVDMICLLSMALVRERHACMQLCGAVKTLGVVPSPKDKTIHCILPKKL